MILLVAAAIFGAALGLFMRNTLLAILAAPVTLGAAQFAAIKIAEGMIYKPDQADLATTIQSYAGSEPSAILSTVVAALMGAGIAALMMTMSRKERETHDGDAFISVAAGNLPRTGKRRGMKLASNLSDRPMYADAESRFDKLLDR